MEPVLKTSQVAGSKDSSGYRERLGVRQKPEIFQSFFPEVFYRKGLKMGEQKFMEKV